MDIIRVGAISHVLPLVEYIIPNHLIYRLLFKKYRNRYRPSSMSDTPEPTSTAQEKSDPQLHATLSDS